jgi:hypothetical protein
MRLTATFMAGLILLGVVAYLCVPPLSAQPLLWDSNGVMVRQGYHIEWQRVGVRGADGQILYAWSDTRTGDRDVYVQKLSATGQVVWQAGGLPIVHFHSRQEDPEIVEVNGGWIIAWIDFRDDTTGDVWAQKIDANGNRLWDTLGVVVNSYPFYVAETSLRAADDGNGGAVIAWIDGRGGDAGDIYAQHLLSNGTVDPTWPPDGLAIGVGSGGQTQITSCVDGAGGMILAWQDGRNNQPDIYMSRIQPDGSRPWGTNGMALCTASGEQKTPKVDIDGQGGALVAWVDARNGPFDIYYQHVNANGQLLLESEGRVLCNADRNQNDVRIVYDGNGGAICVWADYRVDGVASDIYSQKINSDGSVAWADNGISICSAPFSQEEIRLTSDLRGGVVIAWEDSRQTNGDRLKADVYAQRVDASGDALWATDGIVVIDSTGMQTQPLVRPDGQGGAFIAWSDTRNGSISARVQRVDSLGTMKLDAGGIELVWGLDGDAEEPLSVVLTPGRVACVWKDARLGVRGTALYFQIIDSLGHIELPANGSPVAGDIPLDVPADQQNHRVCPDGEQGLFVIWEDQRTSTKLIRAQHINVAGDIQWSEQGVVVAPADRDEDYSVCAPDGAGGLYVAWSGRDTLWQIDVYAQRLNSMGESVWAEPLRLQSTYADDIPYDMVPDGHGHAILTWEAGTSEDADIYGACLDQNGTLLWSAAVCDTAGPQRTPMVVCDGAGGAYFAWKDQRRITESDIYAQHIDSNGAAVWVEDGLAICTEPNDQVSPQWGQWLAVDEAGNLFVAWEDYRNGVDRDIYLQKVSPEGVLEFPASGLPVVLEESDQYEVQTMTESRGGIYLAWTDIRSGHYPDIYAMHLDSVGENASPANWPTGGEVVCDAENLQHRCTIAHDGGGGAIVLWQDWRASGKAPLINIWAQRLNDRTVDVPRRTGPAVPQGYALEAFPNPFNPITEIRFSVPRREQIRLRIYDVLGRQVTTLVDEPIQAGSYRLRWNAQNVASGLYFCRMEATHYSQTMKLMLLK